MTTPTILAALALALGVAPATAAVTQPKPPRSGPGSNAAHAGFRVHAGGSGNDAWYVFEPTRAAAEAAPLAIVMHGYYEFSGYDQMDALHRAHGPHAATS